MNRRLEERRAQHARYKEDVATRGKPFYPYAMFHDTVMSLLVVSVIAGLAVIWKFTAEEGPTEEDSGWLGKLYDEPADPGTTSFIPRPDWYFYFLFYLLRIFKWPESVILGTVGIPTLALVLLLALPFLDVRRERRVLRRPVALVGAILTVLAMGVLTYKGATARESIGSELLVARAGVGRGAGLRRKRARRSREPRSSPRRAAPTAIRTWAPGRRTSARRTSPTSEPGGRERGLLRPLRRKSGRVREHRDAAVRAARRGEPPEARGLPGRLKRLGVA